MFQMCRYLESVGSRYSSDSNGLVGWREDADVLVWRFCSCGWLFSVEIWVQIAVRRRGWESCNGEVERFFSLWHEILVSLFFSKCVWRHQNYDKGGLGRRIEGIWCSILFRLEWGKGKRWRVVMVRGTEFWVMASCRFWISGEGTFRTNVFLKFGYGFSEEEGEELVTVCWCQMAETGKSCKVTSTRTVMVFNLGWD